MALIKRVPGWLWLLLLALCIRLAGIGNDPLWYDESFTAWLSRLRFDQMWDAVKGDVHPPLYYVVSWINFHICGQSEFCLRWPSAVLGTEAVLLTYLVALNIGLHRHTALLAGALAAILPGTIYYAQEARMYSLLSVLVLLMIFAALRSNWQVFFLAALGTVFTHNLGLLYVACIGGMVILQQGKMWRNAIRPALMLIGVFAAWLPWASVMLSQMKSIDQGFWMAPLSLVGMLQPLVEMSVGWRFDSLLFVPAWAAIVGLSGVSLFVARRWLLTKRGLILVAGIFGPPLLAGAVSFLWRNIYLPRAFLPGIFLMCIVWAHALLSVRRDNRRLLQAITTATLVIGLANYYLPAAPRSHFREWAAEIRTAWQPGDIIYHTALHTAITTQYYLPDLPYAVRPAISDLNQSLTEATKVHMGFIQADLRDLINAGHGRIWAVSYLNPMSQNDEIALSRVITTLPGQMFRRAQAYYVTWQVYLIDFRGAGWQ